MWGTVRAPRSLREHGHAACPVVLSALLSLLTTASSYICFHHLCVCGFLGPAASKVTLLLIFIPSRAV